MMHSGPFQYQPLEYEFDKAGNSYLMSLMAFAAGLPLPIFNLIATLIFYFANRNATYFVRWHCTQAMLSQLAIFFVNSYMFWWTVSLIWFHVPFPPHYFYFLAGFIILNIVEIIFTIYTLLAVKRGEHVSWFFFSNLTDVLCKP